MSSFEFILISIAIVVGFGISEILAGWGRQLRYSQEVRPYPLQIVASLYLLSLSIRFLWALWALQGAEWTYARYLLVFIPALILALAAHLMRVDVEGPRRTPRDQYFAAQRPFFGLLTAFPILTLTSTFYNLDHFRAAPSEGGVLFLGVMPIAIGAFVWMAISSNPRHHWIAWALAWFVNLAISFTVLPTLGAP